MATEIMPPETKTAPKMKRALGTSAKISTPSKVAAIGSNNANVAVSNDLRLERDEKYKVCAKAVGKTPKPTSIRTTFKLKVDNMGADHAVALAAASTVKVDNI